MRKEVEFHHGVLPKCLAALCHEQCEQSVPSVQKCHDYAMSCVSVPCIQELIKVTKFKVKRRWCSRVHNYLSGQKVWGSQQSFGNGHRVYNYLSGQKLEDPCNAMAMAAGFTTI